MCSVDLLRTVNNTCPDNFIAYILVIAAISSDKLLWYLLMIGPYTSFYRYRIEGKAISLSSILLIAVTPYLISVSFSSGVN